MKIISNIPENELIILQAQEQMTLFLLGESSIPENENKEYAKLNDFFVNKSNSKRNKNHNIPIIFNFLKK